jgi:hypothetical protein
MSVQVGQKNMEFLDLTYIILEYVYSVAGGEGGEKEPSSCGICLG